MFVRFIVNNGINTITDVVEVDDDAADEDIDDMLARFEQENIESFWERL